MLQDPTGFSELEAFHRLAAELWSHHRPEMPVLEPLGHDEVRLRLRLLEVRPKGAPAAPTRREGDVAGLILRLAEESARSVSPLLRLRRLTVVRFFGKKQSPVEADVVVWPLDRRT